MTEPDAHAVRQALAEHLDSHAAHDQERRDTAAAHYEQTPPPPSSPPAEGDRP